MAAQDVPFGQAVDFFNIGGEPLKGGTPVEEAENVTPLRKTNGTVLQEDCTSRKMTVTSVVAVDDDGLTLPNAGETWTPASGPTLCRIDSVTPQGEDENQHLTYQIVGHYYESVTDTTATAAEIAA